VGSYGKVKLCMNIEDRELYAIKIMKKSVLMKRRVGLKKGIALEDVKREIDIMKRLDNFFVIKLFEVIDDPEEDKLFLILEYAEGRSIRKGEMECEPLSEEKLRKYFHDIICGLEYIHSQKIIHRDIKPQNLLLTAGGTVKLSDFGVSIRIENEDVQNSLKRTVGSPMFLAPELCATATSFINGPPIDIWSLGVTLFFFTFGKYPFVADTEMQLYENIRTKKLIFPHRVDRDLQDLLKKLLTKDPNFRIVIKEIKKHPWTKFERYEAKK